MTLNINATKKDIIILTISLAAITACYLLTALVKAGLHFHLGETDTQMFFAYANRITDSGGTLDCLGSMFNGSFTSSNQHPLFPYIMTLYKKTDISWFINTKLINIITGLAVVYIVFIITLTLCGVPAAVVSAALLIANDNFIFQTTMVSCEPLLMLFSILSIYFLYRGLDDNRYWIPAGIFTGLMYMTKASALFLVFGFGLFLLFDVRFRILELIRNRYLWLFFLMFVLVSLPLLVRNTAAFGFPFYNHNVKMLAMERDEWFSGKQIPEFSVLLKKGVLYYIRRLFFGLLEEMRIMVHAMFSFSIFYKSKFVTDTHSMFQKILASITGVLLLAGSLASIRFLEIEKRKKLFILFIIMGFYLPLSWYSITSPHRRYLLPATVLFIMPLSAGIVKISGMIYPSLSKVLKRIHINDHRTLVSIAAVIILVFFAVFYSVLTPIPSLSKTYALQDRYLEAGKYISDNLPEGKFFLRRGKHNYGYEIFFPEIETRRKSFRILNTFEEFNKTVTENRDIEFILLNSETHHFSRKALAGYVDKDNTNKYIFTGDREGLILKRPIPGWEVVMADTKKPVEVILFKRNGKPSHQR